jgi:hypothetical protein
METEIIFLESRDMSLEIDLQMFEKKIISLEEENMQISMDIS